jgi:hypothetical protein
VTDRRSSASLIVVNSRLAIDYGAATVRAALITPAGVTVLTLDGTDQMSTAVHVGDTATVAGAAAWRQAATDPGGFVPSPLRVGTGQITVGGREVEVADLVAVTLRQVAATAQQILGTPVDEVYLIVPAGWGPRRRTWLRHAARTAGVFVARLIEAPLAALPRLDPAAGHAGRPVLVVDLGAGGEATVVRPAPAGAEVLSTLADPDTGGDSIDAALLHTWIATGPDDLPGESRWTTLANARAARHALSEQTAVTMPLPDGSPPMIVNAAQVAEAARPILARAGELAAQALANADLTLEQLGGVYLIGGAAITPDAAQMIAAKLGAIPRTTPAPHLAGVLGVAGAEATTATAATAEAARRPPLRRLVTLALPGVASLILYAHFVLSATFNNGTPARPSQDYYVQASWGELTVAALLAAICVLQAASLIAAVLDHRTPGPPATSAGRVTAGLGLAIAAGIAAAGLYAVTAAVFFNLPVTDLTRRTVLPILPLTGVAVVVAVLTWRRPTTPTGGWDGFLTFPASSITAAAGGILAVSLWWHGGLPWWLNGWTTSIGLAGGLLIGIAAACALTRHPAARLALTLLLGVFTTIISRAGPDILAIIYAITVACWWAWRAWLLIRTPVPHR